MKKIVALTVMLFGLNSFAQIHIEGTIYDKGSNEPLQAITILFTSGDEEKGTYSNQDGTFDILVEKGQLYQVEFSSVFTKKLHLPFRASKDTVWNIYLEEASYLLNEITIQQRKKLFENKIDRMVYNIGGDPLAQTMTTVQLLNRIPMLRLRDNSLRIVGKGEVKVSVNGKIQQVAANEILMFINNFDPSLIQRIEVITTPPSKYSAEGNAGIINIVTKNTDLQTEGYHGSIRSSFQQRSLSGTDNSLALNYKKNKITISGNLNYTVIGMKTDLYSSGNDIEEQTDRTDHAYQFGTYAAVNYKPSDNHDFSLSMNYYDGISKNSYENTRTEDFVYQTSGQRRNEYSKYVADFNYEYKLDTLGRTLSFFSSYNSNEPTEDFRANSYIVGSDENDKLNNLSKLGNEALSIQGDLYLPYDFGSLNFGVQYYSLISDSEMNYELNNDQVNERFDYDEDNYSAYFDFTSKKIGKFIFKGGLRYERNTAKLISSNGNESVDRKMNNLFPTFYVLYNLNKNSKLSLNYSKRINRPSFTSITPFRFYNNRYSYITGNPAITPFISNNIEAKLSIDNFQLSLYANYIDDGYGRVDIFEENLWKYTFENYYDQANYGVNTSYLFSKFDWMETDIFANLYQTNFNSNLDFIADNFSTAFSYQINNRFYLDTDKKYTLIVNYWQELPFYKRNIYYYTFANLNIGGNFTIIEDKLNIGLYITDVANQAFTKTKAEYKFYDVYRREYFDARSFRFSVRFNWGSRKINEVKKNRKFTERNRIN